MDLSCYFFLSLFWKSMHVCTSLVKPFNSHTWIFFCTQRDTRILFVIEYDRLQILFSSKKKKPSFKAFCISLFTSHFSEDYFFYSLEMNTLSITSFLLHDNNKMYIKVYIKKEIKIVVGWHHSTWREQAPAAQKRGIKKTVELFYTLAISFRRV